MQWRSVLLVICLAPVTAAAGPTTWLREQLDRGTPSVLLDREIAAQGLRQVLEQAAHRAIAILGTENGYLGDPRLKIPMPEPLRKIKKPLRRLGQGRYVDDFITVLNRAAETAVPAAQTIFVESIRQLRFKDVLEILNGPDDAATQYLRRTTGEALARRFRPIVAETTDQVGVTRAYKLLVERAGALASFVNAHDLDLDGHVTRKALDGLFLLMAEQEARIRRDPRARTTGLLRRIFD